jgi:thiol-disulfide isomerase/thioredoxin
MTLHTSQHRPARRRSFVRVGAVLMAILMLATACSSSGSEASGTGVDSSPNGTPVDFGYDDFDGSSAQLADLPEGPIVVNFFASWCPTCIAELPDFQAVSQNMAGQVTFLGLATQDRVENAVQLIADAGVTYTVGNDQNGEIFQIFKGLGMPTTVFINADRTVAKVHTGVLDAESLTDTINDELLS